MTTNIKDKQIKDKQVVTPFYRVLKLLYGYI